MCCNSTYFVCYIVCCACPQYYIIDKENHVSGEGCTNSTTTTTSQSQHNIDTTDNSISTEFRQTDTAIDEAIIKTETEKLYEEACSIISDSNRVSSPGKTYLSTFSLVMTFRHFLKPSFHSIPTIY